MGDVLKNVDSQAQSSTGTAQWDNMNDEQKKQTFDALPSEKKKGKTYTEWIAEGYQHQKENWMPWIEDFYLKWFTKDNKASYATKGMSCGDVATVVDAARSMLMSYRYTGQEQSHWHRTG